MTKEEKLKIFNKIYENIDGFSLSLAERKELGIKDKSFVYGEIVPESFCEILEKLNINKNTIFYDLGSGVGKAVILTKLIFDIKKSVGIEYLSSLYQASIQAYQKLKEIINIEDNSIYFIKGDFFTVPFNDANLVFINSTCFSEEQMERIVNLSLNLERGSKLIVLTKKITDNQNFELLTENQYPFSWGYATVRIYERK
jgi:SAM-dependent methyltransferase